MLICKYFSPFFSKYYSTYRSEFSSSGAEFTGADRKHFWSHYGSMGEPKHGPKIYFAPSSSPITFTNCSFTALIPVREDSYSTNTAAIVLDTPAPVTISSCSFTDIHITNGGTVIMYRPTGYGFFATIHIEHSAFTRCSSSSSGGALYLYPDGHKTIVSSSFSDCSSGWSGGACFTSGCEYSFCKFEGNRATERAGAVCDENDGRIQFCVFLNNQAPNYRDWYCTIVFSCTRSEDVWEDGAGQVFVTGNGNGEECSPLQPCRSFTSAVSTAQTIGVSTIHVGEGPIGAVTLPSDFGSLTIRHHFDFEEGRTNTPTSSFSISCEQGSGADLDSLSLSPLPGMPLLSCGQGSHSSHIKNCRIDSVKGVSAPLFAASDEAQLYLDQVFFENISQVSSTLISVKDLALVSLSNVLFRLITTTHPLIEVAADGSCSISQSLFHTVTRSEGDGAAAIDITDCQSLNLQGVTFSHCISKDGKAGAITADVSDPNTLYLRAFFLNNRGKDKNCAHDIFLTGFDSEEVSDWFYSPVSSFSEFPQVIDGSDSPPKINIFYTISIAENDVPSAVTLNNQPVIFLLDSPFIDLSRTVFHNRHVDITIKSTSEIPITIPPLALETQIVSITGFSALILQPFLSPPQTAGPLFAVSDNSNLTLKFLFHRLKSEITEPLITVSSGSDVTLSWCAFTSDGGVHSAPLVRSLSYLKLYDTSVYDFTFADHSCFECDGGSFVIASQAYYSSAVIANITTTGDGAAFISRNARVMINSANIFDCHARNGGAAFLHNCQDVSIDSMLVMRCSAESKGGAFFVHSDESSAHITINPICIECSAEFGGGMFLDVSHFQRVSLRDYGMVSLLSTYFSTTMFLNCLAAKGGGMYVDGDWSNIESVLFEPTSMSNGGPLVCGQDIFFSQSIAESFSDFDLLLQNLTENSWSMSTRSSDDAQFKQVEVEGHPEWSRNLDCPKIVLIADEYPSFMCISEKKSQSSSLNDYLPLLHLKDKNNKYRQIPIFLRDKVYFFQTGVVTEQSLLLTPEPSTNPVPSSILSLGYNYWKEDRFFVRLEKEGHVEISEVPFIWGIDLGLCEVVDGSGTAKISSCSITLNVVLSLPFLSCSAGTLVISQSSFTTTDSSPLTFPLVHSSPLSSFACNSATDQMRIELDEVQFSNLNVEASVDGVVQLEGVDSLRLKNVEFSNVKNGTLDAVRIVVVGSGLFETIEPVQTSGFPARGTELDGLYKSLDISEPVTSKYRSPTLLLYLNAFDAETVIVSRTGRDGMWCGDADFPCRSLNEADKHLKTAVPSTIVVQTSAVLHSELDLIQDVTKITSGNGEKGQIEVSKEGCLINQADIHTHSLTLDSLIFSLTSDRSKTLLISQSGSLIVTSCSFASSSSSALTSKLVEVRGGSVELHKVELSSLAFTDTLLSFSSFVSVDLHTVTHKSCSPHPLMTFVGKDTTSSIVEMRDCVFKGISSSESNEEPLCEWDTGLFILTNCSLEGFTSTFSHISQGALLIADSVVSLKQSLFEVNGPRDSSFPSLNWNIGCFGKSEIELASSLSTDLSSSSNWISTSDECVVRRGDSTIVPHPFFIPTLSIDNCSSKLDQKSKNFEVSISGLTLIPCGLVLVVEEVTDKVEGKNVTFPVQSSFSTVLNDTSISLTLPESSFTQLDAKLAWNVFLAFENDGRTDSFVFKRTAKAIRAEAMGKTLPWLIPLLVTICVLILIALVVIFLCRRRRTAGQTTKMSEMKEEDTVQIDEKVEVDQGTQLGVHANEAVDPLSKQSNMETLPEQQQSSDGTFSDGLVEALRCGGKLEMTVVREQDSLYNMLHVQKEKKTTIVKRVIERQLAQGLEAVANASLNASVLTRLSSHWVMFDSNGRVCLKMQDTESTPSLPNQQQKQVNANVSQEAQRWKAPEVVKAEEGQMSHQPIQQEIDPHRAAVFSLGLVLWEIETGSVPFAEQDATNAQRQLGTGAHPKMEGVGSKMQELIVECLALDPNERPELSEVHSFLLAMDDDAVQDENEAHSHP
ncbi:hypothetical protein BLNAU_14026 [Blattamonas nauphoetae]|uniref:Protein kinase domain-containing protein n=1 Tax=Blattamonas nauphoetae TaxID=2049346 RepID=A0ABQ9XHZ6_9EUKA|nr:hypothetical protein BLNAU_14026 [Blattamonas nauphoetae]